MFYQPTWLAEAAKVAALPAWVFAAGAVVFAAGLLVLPRRGAGE